MTPTRSYSRQDQFVDIHFESVDPPISRPERRLLRVEAATTTTTIFHAVAYSIKSNYNS